MSTHNICFCGEIRKISAFFGRKKCLICCYGVDGSNCSFRSVSTLFAQVACSVVMVNMVFFIVVQNRITAYWFKNKELALAFGVTLAFSRLGSVLNFILTENFEGMYGLTWTLWGGRCH